MMSLDVFRGSHDWRELLVQFRSHVTVLGSGVSDSHVIAPICTVKVGVFLLSINSSVVTGSSSRQHIVHSHHCGQAMASGEGAMVNRSRKAGCNGFSHYFVANLYKVELWIEIRGNTIFRCCLKVAI